MKNLLETIQTMTWFMIILLASALVTGLLIQVMFWISLKLKGGAVALVCLVCGAAILLNGFRVKK